MLLALVSEVEPADWPINVPAVMMPLVCVILPAELSVRVLPPVTLPLSVRLLAPPVVVRPTLLVAVMPPEIVVAPTDDDVADAALIVPAVWVSAPAEATVAVVPAVTLPVSVTPVPPRPTVVPPVMPLAFSAAAAVIDSAPLAVSFAAVNALLST